MAMTSYQTKKSGEPESDNPDNLRFMLKGLQLEIRLNAWTERLEIRSAEGGHPLVPEMHWKTWTIIDDSVVSKLRMHGARTHTRLVMTTDFIWNCLTTIGHKNRVDPAVDAFAEMQKNWDGVRRLDYWLSEACGVPDDAYHRAVGRVILGGVVMRVRHPGCKFDVMPVFHGPQGTLKSSLAEALAPDKAWFTDTVLLGMESKELVLALSGILIAEVGEMGTRGSANANLVKAMISRKVDRGRTAYARAVVERPRRNVFIGTCNDSHPLTDPTGNRRFLPIAVADEINLEWVRENIAQLYGEAATLEAQGETFMLPRGVWTDAATAQDAVTEQPEFETYFDEWFAPTDLGVFVTAADLADFARQAAHGRALKKSQYLEKMRRLGFIESHRRVEGKPAKVYARGEAKSATRISPQTMNGRTTTRIAIQGEEHQPGQVSVPVRVSPPY